MLSINLNKLLIAEMDSTSKVGEIFKQAGEEYNKLAEKVLLLHPSAQEFIQLETQKKEIIDNQGKPVNNQPSDQQQQQ